jgi:septal ring factor EnvC (AmiA/AmiB activator)
MMAMNNCLNCFNANILMMNQHQMLTTFYNTIIQNDVNAKETAEKNEKILKEVIEKVEKNEKNAQEATAQLSSQIVKLTNELTDVKNELTDVKNELTVVKKELTDVVHTLSAREIGASADRFALNQIFPKCIGNFGIKTLAVI